MKTHLRIFAVVGTLLLLSTSFALATIRTVPGDAASIQAAINASSSGDAVQLVAFHTYNESVTINVTNLTLMGVDSTCVITPPSGNGINVTASSVTIQNLKVTGAADNGIYAHNVSNLNIIGVIASVNGTSAVGSGIYVDDITGTSALTNITASSNQLHGISIGDGSNGLTVNGGTFIGNGVSGNTGTGGGINIHSVSSSISNITVEGTINSTWNMNAGIIIYAEASSGSINTVTIGATGTVTLTGNGSGSIGEGVAVAGNVTTVNITAQFTEGSLAHGAGVAVVGTDNTGSHSPSGVTISNSTFSGYGLATPAITLASSSSSPTYISTNPVTATTGNTFGADGYATEDLIYHKLDNASLGLVTTDASNLYVTTNSGSIQRGIDAATSQTVNVGTGYYTESLTLNKAITLAGVDTSAKDHPASGVGITVTVSGATVKNLVVDSSVTDGISASGLTSLSLSGVVSRNNAGSGAQLSNCGSVTITNGSYSNNTHEGINAVTGSNYTINGTSASGNGSGSNGSGIDLDGFSGTSTATNVWATSNHHHGLTIGNNSSGVAVIGGTFTGNGTTGDATTGGGVNVYASSNATISNIIIDGTINASNNTTAGIYLFGDNSNGTNQINNVTIGDTGSVTLTNNGSSNATYNGGAGVLIFSKVSNAVISHCAFTKGTAQGDGLMNLGDSTSGGSPTGTTVSNSTFSGYTSARPAVTLTDSLGHHSLNDVTATNNTFTYRVLVRAILQGPFIGSIGSMDTLLAKNSLIPLTQPYGTAPYNVARFNYGGTETTTSSALTSNSIVDWVLIELRATSNGSTVAQKAGLLKKDGNLYDVDGTTAGVLMTDTQNGYNLSHYIVFKHRNHLPVMSAALVALPNATAYDFTSSSTTAYVNASLVPVAASALVALPSSSLFGIPDGDIDFNGGVGATDISLIVTNVGVLNAYSLYDIDLNGGVGASDVSAVVTNVGQQVQVP